MNKYQLIITVFLTSIYLTACGGGNDAGVELQSQTVKLATTDELLMQIRQNRKVPAVGGLIWQKGNIKEIGVSGLRVNQGSTPVTLEDKWHLGSITKSVTATLVAKLVELQLIDWETQIQDIFEVHQLGVNQRYHAVTIKQLLAHHGGMTGDVTALPKWADYFSAGEAVVVQRRKLAEDVLKFSTGKPQEYTYSNGGYIIAGAMVEHVTGQSWEELVVQYVFDELEVYDVGFGAPDEGFNQSQPYGHTLENGIWKSYSPQEPLADNPVAFGPAGTLHMSIESLMKYTLMHLNGRNNQSEFLSQSSFQQLHSIYGSDYALGWFVDGENRSHMGTNTRWYAKVGWNAQQSVVAIAVTNAGGERGDAATDDVVNSFLERLNQ